MKNFSTWLLVLFMTMFWVFRIVVAFTSELSIDFGGIETLNQQMEIILLFVVLVCIILVVKRKLLGGLIYLLSYGMYFGTTLVMAIDTIMSGSSTQMGMDAYFDTIIAFIGIILPIAVLIDLLIDKNRKLNPKDKKTDWFYKNKDYDRKLDERSDKNNYRTL